MNTLFVVAVVATHQRPKELARLLKSLADQKGAPIEGLRAILVVDNGSDPAIQALVEQHAFAHYLDPGDNLGCGGGLHFGETKALESFQDQLTHLWILDDDVVVPENILAVLSARMREQNAEVACPMVLDANGRLGWFPGLLDRQKFDLIKRCKTADEFLFACGPAPVPFSWAQGISLLVSRRTFLELGPHRTDYWVRGEDLEFSLRITHQHKGIFVPEISVHHLPPETAPLNEREKHAAMLQNICYTSLRLPHGRRIARTIPGNFLRFLRTWGPGALPQACRAFWLGAIGGCPAGSCIHK